MNSKIISTKILILASSIFLFLLSFSFSFAETMSMSFTVDGSSGSVSRVANYMTFKWSSTNASYCSASASNHYNWSGNKKTSGAEQIFVGWPGTITYKLTCFDTEGRSISRSVGVSIPSTTTGSTNGTFTNSTTNTNTTSNTNVTSSYTCKIRGAENFRSLVIIVINCFLTPVVTLIVSLAILLFVWGVFKFIRAEGEEKEKGKSYMVWGIVGIFVMVSIWGLVAILQNTFPFN